MNKDFNVYKWRREHLTENENASYVKKIKDLTWDDVAGLSLPTGESGGVLNTMDNRDMVSPEKRESMLNNWKERITNSFPNALNMDIRIDKNNPTWFERAMIIDPEYIKAMEEKNNAFQSDYNKYKGRYQGD